MERVYFTEHNGKRILVQDLSESKHIADNIAIFEWAERLIMAEPPASVRLLTNVTNAHYSPESVERSKQFALAVGGRMVASATVGAAGLKKVVVHSLEKTAGRSIPSFDSAAEALDWLSSQ